MFAFNPFPFPTTVQADRFDDVAMTSKVKTFQRRETGEFSRNHGD